jgi:hypothetical protein
MAQRRIRHGSKNISRSRNFSVGPILKPRSASFLKDNKQFSIDMEDLIEGIVTSEWINPDFARNG